MTWNRSGFYFRRCRPVASELTDSVTDLTDRLVQLRDSL